MAEHFAPAFTEELGEHPSPVRVVRSAEGTVGNAQMAFEPELESHNAIQAIASLSRADRFRIFILVRESGDKGVTHKELSKYFRRGRNALLSNVSVLVRAGLLKRSSVDNECTYQTDSGKITELIDRLNGTLKS
ncbi:MAG: hypothetical protein J0H01_37570 [Rhizobiales bacterium]|nr:hypothetical protein [Hyphomicrobiales bacterium]